MSVRYPHVHVAVPHADVELAGCALWECGATGVEERDATTLNRPDSGDVVTLVASFGDEAQARAAALAVAVQWPARVEFVEGDEWRVAYKRYFKATRIGERLVVRPPWEAYAPGPGEVVLILDPGAAFGTGTHETTRLVLEELQTHARPGVQVLDVGCGSGILAIASLLLGAQRARAIDVDPEAVRVARENAQINGVERRMQVAVSAAGQPVQRLQAGSAERYRLVLANIETRVLVPLAGALIGCLDPGGILILSGILAGERERVLAAYAVLRPLRTRELGEWVALVLQKPS